MNEPRVKWGDDGFASESGWAVVYISDTETGEYQSACDIWISTGTGLPAGTSLNAPPENASDKAIVMVEHSWVLVDDYRMKIAFYKNNKEQCRIKNIGPISDDLTLLEPTSKFDVWKNNQWVRDADAEVEAIRAASMAEYSARITLANQQIAIITPAVDGGYAKPEHKALLLDWQRYRYELTLVPELTGWPEQPKWPEQPVKLP
jgi:hypothetical protein